MGKKIFGLVLPGLFLLAWFYILNGWSAPGAIAGEAKAISDVRWLLYFAGFSFVASSIMHSIFAKHTAASIGWKTNSFQYELAFVSLGLGLACFYAVHHVLEALTTAAIPTIIFLFLAGANHLYEIVKKKNYAPNNTLILVWDFGMPISLAVLLYNIGVF